MHFYLLPLTPSFPSSSEPALLPPPPPLPLVWEGLIHMPGTNSFSAVAYSVSGSTDYISEVRYYISGVLLYQ